MLDQETLRAALEFRRERAWETFHTPQNFEVAISVEAGELLEQFQWMLPNEARPTSDQREAIEQEVADVVILMSYPMQDLGIDVNDVVRKKLLLNALRYPLENHVAQLRNTTRSEHAEYGQKPAPFRAVVSGFSICCAILDAGSCATRSHRPRIAAKVDTEYLFDEPYVDRKKVRVAVTIHCRFALAASRAWC